MEYPDINIDYKNINKKIASLLYNKLVKYRKIIPYEKKGGEHHHIIPKCIKPTEETIYVSSFEHLILHYLLCFIYKYKGLKTAFLLLSSISRFKKLARKHLFNLAEHYDKMREQYNKQFQEDLKKGKWITNIKTNKQILISKYYKVPEGYRLGGKNPYNKGKSLTEEHCKK